MTASAPSPKDVKKNRQTNKKQQFISVHKELPFYLLILEYLAWECFMFTFFCIYNAIVSP